MDTNSFIDETISVDSFGARVLLLEDDARKALWMVMQKVLVALENDGCVICAFDTRGTGVMSVAAIGNQDMVYPLMSALSEVHSAYISTEGESIQ